MKLTNTQIYEKVKKILEKEFFVPELVKNKLWFDYDIDASGIVLNEKRPDFGDTDIVTKSPIVKLKYHSGLESWSIFWMPSDMKWHKLAEKKPLRVL